MGVAQKNYNIIHTRGLALLCSTFDYRLCLVGEECLAEADLCRRNLNRRMKHVAHYHDAADPDPVESAAILSDPDPPLCRMENTEKKKNYV